MRIVSQFEQDCDGLNSHQTLPVFVCLCKPYLAQTMAGMAVQQRSTPAEVHVTRALTEKTVCGLCSFSASGLELATQSASWTKQCPPLNGPDMSAYRCSP